MTWWGPSWFCEEGDLEPTAATVVLVAGLDVPRALRLAGVDALGPGPGDRGPSGEAAELAAVRLVPAVGPATALLARDIYPGDIGELVRVLSRRGSAACVTWDVDDLVHVVCARRGRPPFVGEVGDDPGRFPRGLRSLARRAVTDDADLRGLAAAMAAQHTGLRLDDLDATEGPKAWFPLSRPVLGLRVTPDELVGLGYPTPRLVEEVRSAGEEARRRLAGWACRTAAQDVGLAADPTVVKALDDWERGHAVAGSPALARMRTEAQVRAFEAEAGLSETGPSTESLASQGSWASRHWALESVAYLGLSDSVAAALGATYCASVPLSRDPRAKRSFLREASRTLLGED